MRQQKASPSAFGPAGTIALSFVVLTLTLCAALPANAADGQIIARNTPSYVASAKNIGTEDPSKTIEVSIWLNPHNKQGMDALARDLYDRTSPNYRHFLKRADITSRFAPTADEAKTVQEFFESHNLKVVSVGGNNFFVRARGTVADVENAFHVQLNDYQVRDQVMRANSGDPYVEGPAAPLVRAISGLDSGAFSHPSIQKPTFTGGTTNSAVVSQPIDYSSVCFPGPVKETFSTDNNGTLPIGTYAGNLLNLQTLTSPGCAYTPPSVATAFNLTGLYNEGFNGAGQTIVILDWCGSSTIQSDANAFSAAYGLPPVNLDIIYTPTPSLCIGPDMVEINIDVEWAHAVAPGANIDLVVPPSSSFQDIDQGLFYAIDYDLGNVLSGSYGSPESLVAQTELDTESLISEIAAISGISANFSSGDDGDYSAFGISATVSDPADSPYATAVGGVTVSLNSDNSIAWLSGWGNNEALLTEDGFIADPPEDSGFYAGSGGGESNCAVQNSDGGCISGFPKPSFQSSLPGKYRQLPDISWIADPFTGVAILITVPGSEPEQQWEVWGGTSVAAPMFSGLWAIANEEAGEALGQAAQYVYTLPAGAVTDVVPVSSSTNVTASIQETTGTNKYNADAVLGGAATGNFVSAIWNYPSILDTTVVISFGTDCSTVPASVFADGNVCNTRTALHTGTGWDNVTGVGVPNAQAFADSFAPTGGVKK